MRFLILVLLAVVECSAWSIEVPCEYHQEISAKTVVTRFFTVSLGCLVNVTPIDKPNLVYREYYADERGRFLIFDSITGEYETSTLHRAFFLFPRRGLPDFKILDNGTPQVLLASGQTAEFSAATSRMTSMSGATFQEPAAIDLKSTLEITGYSGIWMDTGSKIGMAPYLDPQASSKFMDGSGHSCVVGNSELFNYVDKMYAEPVFFFQTDKALATFLAKRCPQLDVSSLTAAK